MERIQTDDQCQRPATGDYCSEHCANAQKGGMAGDCRCGHPECGEQ